MHQTLSIARRIASAHPEAMLPCPICAASLKAKNLDRHLADLHQAGSAAEAPFPASLEITGVDRRVFWVFLVALPLWVLGVAALALLGFAAGLDPDAGAVPIGLAVLLLAGLVPLVLTELGFFRARLVLDERRVQLCYAFGLLGVEVDFPAVMETGSLWQRRPRAGASTYEHSVPEDVRVGSYLRLSNAGAAVTIACSGSTQLRKHWVSQSFQSGPRRRRWDITLDRVGHVRLQYHLAWLRLLGPA